MMVVFCGIVLGGDPLMGILTTDLNIISYFHFCSFDAQGTPTTIAILTDVGDIITQSSVFIPGIDSMLFLSMGLSGDDWSATVVNSSGSILFHRGYPDEVLVNAAYDKDTNQYFITTYNIRQEKDFVASLDLNNGNLTYLVPVPDAVQVAESTYNPKDHIFFLTTEDNNGVDNLVSIDTQNKKILSTVTLEDSIEILMWDYLSDTMYAWISEKNHTGTLVTIDIETGKRLKTFVSLPYRVDGGTAVLDVNSKIVYASLLDLDIPKNSITPIWVVVDVVSGQYTTKPTSPQRGFPINLVVPVV